MTLLERGFSNSIPSSLATISCNRLNNFLGVLLLSPKNCIASYNNNIKKCGYSLEGLGTCGLNCHQPVEFANQQNGQCLPLIAQIFVLTIYNYALSS